MYHNGIQSYRKTDIITSDPGKLILMCYEGAIKNLQTAKQKFIEKDYEAKFKAVDKVLDILDELAGSLDFEKGGEIARNLSAIYNYMTRRILQSDVEKNIDAFDEIIGLLGGLMSTWQQVLDKRPEPERPPPPGINRHQPMPRLQNHVGL